MDVSTRNIDREEKIIQECVIRTKDEKENLCEISTEFT